jgi:N-methylhydantoinase B
VLDDVIDGYVTPRRAALDYGVVVTQIRDVPPEWEIDVSATQDLRGQIRAQRHAWLEMDAFAVARRYREGDLDALDCLRQYGVVLDWGTGELLPRTTEQMRELLRRRAAAHWNRPERTSS